MVSLRASCYKNPAEEATNRGYGNGCTFLSVQTRVTRTSREVSQEDSFGSLFADGSFHARQPEQPELLSETKNAPSCALVLTIHLSPFFSTQHA